jgi:hypothetical protein
MEQQVYINILLNSNRTPNNYRPVLVVSLDEPAVPEGTAGEAVIDASERSPAVLTSLKRVQQENKCVF